MLEDCILGYKLFAPAFLSQTTGKTEVAGILFLSTEHQDKIRVGLTFFRRSLPYDHQLVGQFIFFVDKGKGSLQN